MQIAKGLEYWEKEWDKGNAYGLVGALTIGKAAKAIDESGLWQQKASSFKEYIKMERGYGYSQVRNFINMFEMTDEFYKLHPELTGTLPTRVIQLIPHLTEENKEELLHAAANIPDAAGWENTIRNLKGKKGTDECDHIWEPWEHCTVCPAKRRKTI